MDPQATRLINIVRMGPVNSVTINHRISFDPKPKSNEEIALAEEMNETLVREMVFNSAEIRFDGILWVEDFR